MPYGDISDLPAQVKDNLPKHAQEIFLASFNSAFEKHKDEQTAFKIAWSAVEKSYEKVGDAWQKIENKLFFTNAEFINKEHDVILQRLNQKLHYKDYGDVFYPVQLFQEMGNQWDGIPIVYAKDHPDFDLFIENPALALQQVNGSIVGKVTNPKVELTGTSRFVAKFQIDNPVIENLIKDGRLAHSTGFKGRTDANNNLISMVPNHVLVFTEGAPRDAGAIILNKDDVVDIQNKYKKPYGDVEYADNGMQEDGVYRYPIDTEDHVRAAWSYINMPKNADKYSADQLSKIKAKIKSAAKKFGIEIKNQETDIEMANEDYTKEDMDAMLDFMKANPGMMDKSMMDKMYSAMDGANQKEYMKGMLKDLQSHPEMIDDEMKSMMKGMKNKKVDTVTEDKEQELTKQLEISNKEKETLTGELTAIKAELGKATEQLKVFAQKETERLKAEEDARWQEIKNKLPVGLTHKEEDVASLRKEYDSNKDAFYMKHFVNAERKELPAEEGKEFSQQGDIPIPSVGNWNPRTKQWEA